MPLLLGTAWAMVGLAPPEFWIARIAIILAAIIFCGTALIWLVLLGWPALGRITAAVALGALSLVGVSEALRWVNGREQFVIAQAAAISDKRSKIRAKLQEFYVAVGPIIARSLPKDISETDFNKYVEEADAWIIQGANWIGENMGVPARERFLDRTGMSNSKIIGAVNENHSNVVLNLTRFRQNLMVLIENSSWDRIESN